MSGLHVLAPRSIFLLVMLSGMAALSWEAVWQIKASLALGVSAWGTAITLAVTMGGMSTGALLMGQWLKARTIERPQRMYGALEIAIGLSGLLLSFAFGLVARLDAAVFAMSPALAPAAHLAGITATLAVPTFCMGATLPVLGLMAARFRSSIAILYGLNTLGAAAGVLIAAFVLIPTLGVSSTIVAIASANIVVGLAAIFLVGQEVQETTVSPEQAASEPHPEVAGRAAYLLVFATGFVTFVLEVAWFRSFTAAFKSTTESFAIMLAAVLIALGLGARFVPALKRYGASPGLLVCLSGILILLLTPVVERFDLFIDVRSEHPVLLFVKWFAITVYVVGAPVLLLGTALPWILDDQTSPRRWGRLYGVNAMAAVMGAIFAAWVFLPLLGFARTAWVAGLIVAGAGVLVVQGRRRAVLALACGLALAVAVIFESGVGRDRVQGTYDYTQIAPRKILAFHEGPQATVSVVQYGDTQRFLFIDGFIATGETGGALEAASEHYMLWMGHLPMLMHPDPEKALVICFGTGQTANAVRRENPESLDIVDINPNVFKMAHYFATNENVLDDPRVSAIVMDGRAWLRRTDEVYDIITLEPMPPTFAGVNALYSREFYELGRSRLGPDGVIAQWLPFHLVSGEAGASIARTFQTVFPNAMLWLDPLSGTGILIGMVNEERDATAYFPGFGREDVQRSLSESAVRKAVSLGPEELKSYGAYGRIITDDNQLLAYGRAARAYRSMADGNSENAALIEQARQAEAP